MISEIENQAAAEPEVSIEQVETRESRFDTLLANLDDDQVLRIHIFDGMGQAEIDGKILVENMNLVFNWIKHMTMPAGDEPSKKSRLKVVP